MATNDRKSYEAGRDIALTTGAWLKKAAISVWKWIRGLA